MARPKKIIEPVIATPLVPVIEKLPLSAFAYYLKTQKQDNIQLVVDALALVGIKDIEMIETKSWAGTLCRVRLKEIENASSQAKIKKHVMPIHWCRYEVAGIEDYYVFRTDGMSQGVWDIFSKSKLSLPETKEEESTNE